MYNWKMATAATTFGGTITTTWRNAVDLSELKSRNHSNKTCYGFCFLKQHPTPTSAITPTFVILNEVKDLHTAQLLAQHTIGVPPEQSPLLQRDAPVRAEQATHYSHLFFLNEVKDLHATQLLT
jgi:hypothetical protein